MNWDGLETNCYSRSSGPYVFPDRENQRRCLTAWKNSSHLWTCVDEIHERWVEARFVRSALRCRKQSPRKH